MPAYGIQSFRIALGILVILLVPKETRAQAGATVLIRVRDADAAAPLAGAQVRLSGVPRAVRSDTTGYARLVGVPPGSRVLEIRRIGYEPLRMELTLAAADTVELEAALLRAPQMIEPVTVSADAVPRGMDAFDARRRRGVGQFLTFDALRAEGDRELGDVLASRLRGVRVVTAADGISRYLVSAQLKTDGILGGSGGSSDPNGPESKLPRGTCVRHVYVDGIFLSDPDISHVDATGIAAVESYSTSEAPPQYRRLGAGCGVVLLWTRIDPGG